jgi:hypothetical protein
MTAFIFGTLHFQVQIIISLGGENAISRRCCASLDLYVFHYYCQYFALNQSRIYLVNALFKRIPLRARTCFVSTQRA